MTGKNMMIVAREWVVTMKASANPELVRQQFEEWVLEDPRHLRAYAQAENDWIHLDRAVNLLRQKGPMAPATLLQEIHDAAERSRRRRQVARQVRKWSPKAAAVLAGVGLLAFLYYSPTPQSVSWRPYVGALGTPERHVLNDGSELYLNGRSEARVRMTQDAREVTLDQGELLVHVTPDRSRPFLVRAGETVVRAVGTLFSVRLEPTGDVETVVKDGSVTVDPKGAPASAGLGQEATTVSAGQAAVISDGIVRRESYDDTEVENRLAWVHGRLYLHGSLAQAVAQFNKSNEREMVIGDAAIAQMNVTGLYDGGDPEEFAESLQSRGVAYKVDGNRIRLFALPAHNTHPRSAEDE